MGTILSFFRRRKRDDPEEELRLLRERLADLNVILATRQQRHKSLSLYVFVPIIAIIGIILHYTKLSKNILITLLLCLLLFAIVFALRWFFKWWLDRVRRERETVDKQMREAVANVLEKLPYRVARRVIKEQAPEFLNSFNSDDKKLPVPMVMPVRPPPSSTVAVRRPQPPALLTQPKALPRVFSAITDLLTGMNNEYALICRYCHNHNGLSPPEEFQFVAFVCRQCRQYNPPRVVRPAGPKIDLQKRVDRVEESDVKPSDSETEGPDEGQSEEKEASAVKTGSKQISETVSESLDTDSQPESESSSKELQNATESDSNPVISTTVVDEKPEEISQKS